MAKGFKKGNIDLAMLLLLGLSALGSLFSSSGNLLTGNTVLTINDATLAIENGAGTRLYMSAGTVLHVYLNSNYVQKIPYFGFTQVTSTLVGIKSNLTTSSNANYDDIVQTTGKLYSSTTNKIYHPNLDGSRYTHLQLSNSTSAFEITNLKILNTTNQPPTLSDISVSPSGGGWGKTYTFSLTADDEEDNDINVTLWVKNSSGWVNLGKNTCWPSLFSCQGREAPYFPVTLRWITSSFDSSFIGTMPYYFKKTDGTTEYNSSEMLITFTKDTLGLSLNSGDDKKVNRSSGYATLSVNVIDSDKSEAPTGLSGDVYAFKDTPDNNIVKIGTCTVTSEGLCSYNFDPDGNYKPGNKQWYIRFTNKNGYFDTAPTIYNVSVIGNLSIALDSPPIQTPVWKRNVGNDITFQTSIKNDLNQYVEFNSTDILLYIDPPGAESWKSISCSWQKQVSGAYACTWNSQGQAEGLYSVKITAGKKFYLYKTETFSNRFELTNAATFFDKVVTPEHKVFSNISILKNEKITLLADFTNTGANTAYNANLTLSGYGSGWTITPGSAANGYRQNCGAELASGATCSKTWEITLPNGYTLPMGNFTLIVSARWRNPDNSFGTDSTTSQIDIKNNPQIIIKGHSPHASIIDGTTGEVGRFNLKSVGNAAANFIKYNITWTGSSLTMSYTPASPIYQLALGANQTVVMRATIPKYTYQGIYNGSFGLYPAMINSTKKVAVIVPTTKSWKVLPLERTYSKEAGTSGNLVSINITNTGNADAAVTLSGISGNASEQHIATLDVWSQTITPGSSKFHQIGYDIPEDTPPGMYNLTLTYSLDGGTPATQISRIWLNVSDLPPEINSVSNSPAVLDTNYEQEDINVTASDAIGIDAVWIVLNKGEISEDILLDPISVDPGTGSGMYYAAGLILYAGLYTFTAYVNDTSGSITSSGPYTFTAYNTSTLEFYNFNSTKRYRTVTNQSVTCTNNSNVGGCINLRYVINNPSNGGAYNARLRFTVPAGWQKSPVDIGPFNLSNSASKTYNAYFGIPKDYPHGNYSIMTNLTWMNPDGVTYTTIEKTVLVEVSNLISALKEKIVFPSKSDEIKIGKLIHFNFSITDLHSNKIPGIATKDIKIWQTGQTPFTPCVLIESSSGVYNCTWDSLGQTGGDYNLRITAHRNYYSDLDKTETAWFILSENDDSASLIASPSGLNITNMTSKSDYIFTERITFQNLGEGSMRDVNLNFVQKPNGWTISNEGTASCGEIDVNAKCVKEFTVTIPRTELFGLKLLNVEATWITPEGRTSSRRLADPGISVLISEVPAISIDAPITAYVGHNRSNFIGNFKLSSVGTGNAININSTTYNDTYLTNTSFPNLQEWVSFYKNFIDILRIGMHEHVNVTAEIPLGQNPGTYTSEYIVRGTDAQRIMATSKITLNVLTNRDWRANISSYSKSIEQGERGQIWIKLFNNGNVLENFNFNLNHQDLLFQEVSTTSLQKQKNGTIKLYYAASTDQTPGLYPYTLTIADATNSSNSRVIPISITVADLAPRLTNMSLDKQYADYNHENVTVRINASDSIQVAGVWLNITSSTDNRIIPMEFVRGKDSSQSGLYRVKFVPASEGSYIVRAYSLDNGAKKSQSDRYSFQSLKTTEFRLGIDSQNVQVDGVTYDHGATKVIYLNISNIGNAAGYYTNLSITPLSGISGSPAFVNYGTWTEGISSLQEITLSIPQRKAPGIVTLLPTLKWKDPDGIKRVKTIQINVNVSKNPALNIEPTTLSFDIMHGRSTEKEISLLSIGNYRVENLQFECIETEGDYDICNNFDIDYSSVSDIEPANSIIETIAFYANPGISPSDLYSGTIRVTAENNISEDIRLNANVPVGTEWNTSIDSINASVGIDNYGRLSQNITIYNQGNIPMNFNITKEDLDYLTLSSADVAIGKQNESAIVIDFNASGMTPGEYFGTIFVNSTQDSSLPTEISVYFNVINFSILKTSPAVPFTNKLIGQPIVLKILAMNETGNLTLTRDISFSVYIEDEDVSKACTNLLMGHGLTEPEWTIQCNLPNVTTGKYYDIRVVGTYKRFGAVANLILNDYVFYTDVEPPVISGISGTMVQKNVVSNIEANVTDNIGLRRVMAKIYYPNGTLAQRSNMTLFLGGTYTYAFSGTRVIGDYTIIINATDINGLQTIDSGMFEVYKNIYVNFTVLNYSGTPIETKFELYHGSSESPQVEINLSSDNPSELVMVHKTNYSLIAYFMGNAIIFYDASMTEDENLTIFANTVEPAFVKIDPHSFLEGMSVEPNFAFSGATILFNFSKYMDMDGFKIEDLNIIRCGNFNGYSHECADDAWELMSLQGIDDQYYYAQAPTFSAYGLILWSDEQTDEGSGGSGGGGSGGGMPSARRTGVSVSTTKIEKTLSAGESATDSFTLTNEGEEALTLNMKVNDLKQFISFERSVVSIYNGSSASIKILFNVPFDTPPGTYFGSIDVVGANINIPVTLTVRQEFEQLVGLKLFLESKKAEYNSTFDYKVELQNLGEKSKDVLIDLYTYILNESDDAIRMSEEMFTLKDELLLSRSFELGNLSVGNYKLGAVILYSDKNETVSVPFKIVEKGKAAETQAPGLAWMPDWFNTWWSGFVASKGLFYVILAIPLILIALFGFRQITKVAVRKYEFPVPNLKKLPTTTADTIQIGRVTELNKPALIRLKDMTMHTICVGATGGGKTVSAQVLVEEALKRGVNVIVLDPTGQWSGFLQRCNDPEMLANYAEFNMRGTEARGFNGNIRAIESASDFMDIKPFLARNKEGTEGEIEIFSLHKLKNKDIEMFVNSMVKQVFDAQLEESNKLETLIVFDEVHRVLEAFGGSGKGQDMIERGVREFRKWGVGLLLISQVIADFKEQIRANIGTKLQFRSRDKNDLKMVKETFGIEYVKHIVKAAIGRGMFHNPGYNKGMPYFIDVRPLLHHPHKLMNTELEKYEKYNRLVDEIKRKIKIFESRGKDIFDLISILKLLEKNIKKGKFDMVDIYLEEINEKINRY